MKAFMGRYKKSEADEYINSLKEEYEARIRSLGEELSSLREAHERLNKECAQLKEKENIISEVLIDATGRALEIENEYKERAREENQKLEQRKEDFRARLKSCERGVEELKNAAFGQMENLKRALEELSAWSDGGLKRLEADMGLEPEIDSDELERRIIEGANADLLSACRELGLSVSLPEELEKENKN